MTPAEKRAQFAEAAQREADRGAREQPIKPGTDAAIALKGLFPGFASFVRDRRRDEAGREASAA